ncbi:sigma-54-dependent transcriptional regulator [Croceiramulus getboli]|nr:sigma-54 dependent transcriptional regulator [Flavobacteriaceae bacterium YJPT1-3]
MPKILVVEDDVAFCKMLSTFLEKKDHEVKAAFTTREAFQQLQNDTFDVVLSDMRLPDGDGLEILNETKKEGRATQVIMMTGYAEVNLAVKAMKLGAFDYISKPIVPEQILEKIKNALGQPVAPLRNTTSVASTTAKQQTASVDESNTQEVEFIKGVSDASARLNQYIDLVAPTPMSVLITGESGTGKEYVAKSIHLKSKRSDQPFVAVDCGAIPKELANSEFFGHLKGSFTGAISDKTGHFVAANKGTIFLDEIGNLDYALQVQLLRVLQERKVKPVGSNTEIEVDIRIVTATNENLQKAVDRGDFREDLYHRLNEFSIQVPALREREEDLMLFAHLFLDMANNQLSTKVSGFTPSCANALKKYSWPGNLRELKNSVRRAVLLAQEGQIDTKHLAPQLLVSDDQAHTKDYSLFKNKNEQELILDALDQAQGNKSKAARILNIDRKTLYNKLKQYDIKL